MNPNNILDEFKKLYPEIKNVKLKYFTHNKFVGCCYCTTVGDYIYEGKFRYKHIQPKFINITLTDKSIVKTLLHEIAHAITPQYERKVKDEWIQMDHSDKFYKNFHKIILQAYDLKIVDKQYTMQELRKLDKL